MVFPGPEDFESGRTGHPVAKRSDGAALDRELSDVEEANVGQRAARGIGHQVERHGTLDLVDEDLWGSASNREGLVGLDLDVEASRLGVKLDPITDHGRADDAIDIVRGVEANPVPDQVAIMARR